MTYFFDELRLRLLTYSTLPASLLSPLSKRSWQGAVSEYETRRIPEDVIDSGFFQGGAGLSTSWERAVKLDKRRAEDDYVYSRLRASYLLSILDDPNTRRMIFSGAQMRQFDDTAVPIPNAYQKLLRLPFDQYWMEFDEPIQISVQEPGRDDKYLRGLLIKTLPSELRTANAPAIQCVAFYVEGDVGNPDFYTDEAFQLELSTGRVFGSYRAIHETVDPSVYPIAEGELAEREIRRADGDGISGEGEWVFFGEELDRPTRYIGWYERQALHLANLFYWSLTYIMAKGIQILKVDPSRAERRRAARAGIIPQPWHVVQVEPRITLVMGDTAGQVGRQHSYRYDVMGHLRFGRHKLSDGTYRDTVEFVRPHQRGLANSLYIPKTYNVRAGKVEHPMMQDYWEGAI